MIRFADSLNGSDHIAVGISGGADSLALTLLMSGWCQDHEFKLTAFTIDHGLRAEAATEAETVHNLLSARQINHRILKVTDKIGSTRIQETARQRRYTLLAEACAAEGIKTLAVGHHLEDQFETVLMRLTRGSGLKGLCGMAPVRSLHGGVNLIRPLLDQPKSALTGYCRAQNIKWINDPSNEDTQYTRVQLRQQQDALAEIGLTPAVLESSRRKLAGAAGFINSAVKDAHRHCVQRHDDGYQINVAVFMALHPYLRAEIISGLLTEIGQTPYPPRSAALNTLLDQMQSEGFKTGTLNSCLVSKPKSDIFMIRPEHAISDKPVKNIGL
jgi:tRNA(Ile)-lysidine synthase